MGDQPPTQLALRSLRVVVVVVVAVILLMITTHELTQTAQYGNFVKITENPMLKLQRIELKNANQQLTADSLPAFCECHVRTS